MGFATITDVTVSPDLRHAIAYYTVYGDDVQRASTKDAFDRATSHLRSIVAREVRLRYAPTLDFRPDPVPERSDRIEKLIAELHRKEES